MQVDERIEAAMKRYHVPGVALAISWQGREHLRGFGITNADYPLPVDADTLFRIGSTTKTFTATSVMRLVEQGKVDLAAPARRYLPNLALADEVAAQGGHRAPAAEPQRGLAGRRLRRFRPRRAMRWPATSPP